jgi:hypothetical protein
MHTVIIVGAGFATLLACLLLGHAWGDGMPGVLTGAKVFLPLWLLGAAINMAIGVRHGYSWGGELPIFLVVFAIPAVVAALTWWRLA